MSGKDNDQGAFEPSWRPRDPHAGAGTTEVPHDAAARWERRDFYNDGDGYLPVGSSYLERGEPVPRSSSAGGAFRTAYHTAREPWIREEPMRHYGRGPRGYQRSDQRLLEDICERLTYDPELDATGIEVQVKEGIVHLDGEVDTRRSKRLAEAIADSVSGIRDVENRLKIRG